jgi:hypothetical protein
MGCLPEADYLLFLRQIVEDNQQQEEAGRDLWPPAENFPAEAVHMGQPSEADHALFRRRVVENLQRWEQVAAHQLGEVLAHDLQQNLEGSLVEQQAMS